MWNHRDLEDALQAEIEAIFQEEIEHYTYGTRREDQRAVIDASGLFREVIYIEGTVLHNVLAEDFIEGWKSHGTLQRQSREKFDLINGRIRRLIESKGQTHLKVPYTTRIWMAQLK